MSNSPLSAKFCGYSDCTEFNLTGSIGNCNSILRS
jgi:hypothetical protein